MTARERDVTATPPQSDSPFVPGAHNPVRLAHRRMPGHHAARFAHDPAPGPQPVPGPHPLPGAPPAPRAHPLRLALRDTLTLAGLPLLAVLALPAAFAGGGTRR